MNKKGYYNSPFMLAVLALLSSFIMLNHTQTDASRTHKTMLSGQLVNVMLQTEKNKLSTANLMKFSAYQAAYETALSAGNKSILEAKISEHLKNTTSTQINQTIETTPLKQGFMLESSRHPASSTSYPHVSIEYANKISIYIDCGFFTLLNHSRQLNKSFILNELSSNFFSVMADEYNLSVYGISVSGSMVELKGVITNNTKLGDGMYLINYVLERSLTETIKSSYPGFNKTNSSLIMLPLAATAYGNKINESGITRWIWLINLSLQSYIVEESVMEENGGYFTVYYDKPIILSNASITPLKYDSGTLSIQYNLSLYDTMIYSAGGVDSYLPEEYALDEHKPGYLFVPGGRLKWIG